jgi:putative membrane protein
MMSFLLSILINAIIVLAVAYILPHVEVKNFGAALLVALVIAILSPTLGALLTGILRISSLGILFLLGVSRLIANAIVLKVADMLIGGFKVRGFLTAIFAALLMTILGMVADWLLGTGSVFKELY